MFHDISAAARPTIPWLYAHLAMSVTAGAANAWAVDDPGIVRIGDEAFGIVDWIDLVDLAVFTAAGWFTARWIHHANANAPGLGDGMTLSPVGSVGWFFVPVLDRWKPFTGVRETWQVSHAPDAWPAAPVPSLLRAWRACWLAGSLLGNLAAWPAARALTAADMVPAHAMQACACALSIPGTLLLIRIVRRLSAVQAATIPQHVFA